ncbi:MAG: hypothetical protein QXI84_07535 [Thermofilaceae archaeon]
MRLWVVLAALFLAAAAALFFLLVGPSPEAEAPPPANATVVAYVKMGGLAFRVYATVENNFTRGLFDLGNGQYYVFDKELHIYKYCAEESCIPVVLNFTQLFQPPPLEEVRVVNDTKEVRCFRGRYMGAEVEWCKNKKWGYVASVKTPSSAAAVESFEPRFDRERWFSALYNALIDKIDEGVKAEITYVNKTEFTIVAAAKRQTRVKIDVATLTSDTTCTEATLRPGEVKAFRCPILCVPTCGAWVKTEGPARLLVIVGGCLKRPGCPGG